MNILFISSYLPYPLHSGGQVRLYNLLKELSSQHEITIICEKRSHQTEEDISAVQKFCKTVITVNRKKQWTIANILRSGASTHSFLITGHTHPEMQQKILDLMQQETFDLIHVETFYVLQNVPQTNLPIVLVEHNIEYQVYERFIDKVPVLVRPLLKLDIAKMKREESAAWKRASSLVSVSQEDKKVMEQNGYTATVVANGVNTDQFTFREKKGAELVKKILFMGDFNWIQNRDSVKFIIEDIWPQLKLKLKTNNLEHEVKLWVVGRKIPDSLMQLTTDPDVLFDEASSAKPTPEIFQEAAILLAPIRVGGGTSYKILESMSSGTPVVTMPLSASAIGAEDGRHLMVGSTAEELAKKTKLLLDDAQLYEGVSREGRKLIEKNCTWREIAQILDQVYQRTKK